MCEGWSGHWVIHIVYQNPTERGYPSLIVCVYWNTMERRLPPSCCVCVEWNTTQGGGTLRLQEQGLEWLSLQTQAPLPALLQEWPPEVRVGSCFKINLPRWPSESESDGGVVSFANEPPQWLCCRNKSRGGRGSGQRARGGVYVSKTVDNRRKIVGIPCTLALCMFSSPLPPCPSCCIWLPVSVRSYLLLRPLSRLHAPTMYPIPSQFPLWLLCSHGYGWHWSLCCCGEKSHVCWVYDAHVNTHCSNVTCKYIQTHISI